MHSANVDDKRAAEAMKAQDATADAPGESPFDAPADKQNLTEGKGTMLESDGVNLNENQDDSGGITALNSADAGDTFFAEVGKEQDATAAAKGGAAEAESEQNVATDAPNESAIDAPAGQQDLVIAEGGGTLLESDGGKDVDQGDPGQASALHPADAGDAFAVEAGKEQDATAAAQSEASEAKNEQDVATNAASESAIDAPAGKQDLAEGEGTILESDGGKLDEDKGAPEKPRTRRMTRAEKAQIKAEERRLREEMERKQEEERQRLRAEEAERERQEEEARTDYYYSGERDEDGLPHGIGRVRYKHSGLVYRGEFHHGAAHGEGTLEWLNGSVYIGLVVDGKPMEGRLDRADGQILYFKQGAVTHTATQFAFSMFTSKVIE